MFVSVIRQIASPHFRGFWDVMCCLNRVFEGRLGYGKSPCFLNLRLLRVPGPDGLVYNLIVDNGVKSFD
jgi:hypothetical protein